MAEVEMAELEEAELRHRFDRGDFHAESESLEAQRLLRAFDKEREFLTKCERASQSAALDAQEAARIANNWAKLALIIATISALCSIIPLLK